MRESTALVTPQSTDAMLGGCRNLSEPANLCQKNQYNALSLATVRVAGTDYHVEN